MTARPTQPTARIAGRHARPLDEDIRATAAQARNRAAPFDAAAEAHVAALWSDLGKTSEAFQRHLRRPYSNDRVNHSYVGAWHACRWLPGEVRELIAVAIAGTHAGLPDLSELPGICAEGATHSRCLEGIDPDILAPPVIEAHRTPRVFSNAAHRELFTRLIFSAHVDADRAEAQAWEARVSGTPLPAARHTDLSSLHDLVVRAPRRDGRIDELGRLRDAFWHLCKQIFNDPPGWYQLSAPSSIVEAQSLACYAIGHAARHGQRQVIWVCATRAGLEQRVEDLRAIFGDSIIVPSAFDHRSRGLRAAIEDWEAPIVVTTLRDVAALLFDNRPAACRCLHRIACAMVLVEDAWRLPAPIAPAVIDSLRTLTTHFRSTVTFVSTIPPPNVEGAKEIGMPDAFARLEPRTAVTWPSRRAKPPQLAKLIRKLDALPDCLVVWNSPRSLRAFADATEADGWIYLSSRMCPRDRSAVIRQLRASKRDGKTLKVATDQVGETLDVTFEVVWREMTDLPSITVTRQRADAGEHRAGVYEVFPTPTADRSLEAHVTQLMLLNGAVPLTAQSTWRSYERDLKLSRGRCTWAEDLQCDRDQLRFRTVASKTLRIGGRHPMPANVAIGDAGLVPLVIAAPPREGHEDVKPLIKQLSARGPDKLLLRQLMDFTIWVSVEERDRFLKQGRARWIADTVVYLHDVKTYDRLGLR